MVRAIVSIAALALSVAGARASIDLTPAESFYEVEGIRVPNVTFRNGAKDMAYTPPGGWILTGGGKKLTLTPPDTVQAGATIQVASGKDAPPPATADNLKAYGEIALELIPSEAAKVEVVGTAVCALRISGLPLVEVTVNYVLFGQQFRTNILFLPREKDQLRFQFSARAADFPPLLKAFRTSLYSMQGL